MYKRRYKVFVLILAFSFVISQALTGCDSNQTHPQPNGDDVSKNNTTSGANSEISSPHQHVRARSKSVATKRKAVGRIMRRKASNTKAIRAIRAIKATRPKHNVLNKHKKRALRSKIALTKVNPSVFPMRSSIKSKFDYKAASYQPYIQIGGTSFINGSESRYCGLLDLFVPLWPNSPTNLIFINGKINDRSGVPFEGNMHLGYRHLNNKNTTLYGVYSAFDRKKSIYGNYFNQITIGGELWHNALFIGANIYNPIGNKTRLADQIIVNATAKQSPRAYNYQDVLLTIAGFNEKPLPGADAEVGYEFKKGLVGYVGGYYFDAPGTEKVCGPKARITYDWSLDNGRILGVFDQIGLETGMQHDAARGTHGYISANVRIGWLPNKKAQLSGVSRHMVDPVRRDIDIIARTTPVWKKQEALTVKYDPGTSIYNVINIITNNRKITPRARHQLFTYFENNNKVLVLFAETSLAATKATNIVNLLSETSLAAAKTTNIASLVSETNLAATKTTNIASLLGETNLAATKTTNIASLLGETSLAATKTTNIASLLSETNLAAAKTTNIASLVSETNLAATDDEEGNNVEALFATTTIAATKITNIASLLSETNLAATKTTNIASLVSETNLAATKTTNIASLLGETNLAATKTTNIASLLSETNLAAAKTTNIASLVSETNLAAAKTTNIASLVSETNLAAAKTTNIASLVSETSLAAVNVARVASLVSEATIAATKAASITSLVSEATFAAIKATNIANLIGEAAIAATKTTNITSLLGETSLAATKTTNIASLLSETNLAAAKTTNIASLVSETNLAAAKTTNIASLVSETSLAAVSGPSTLINDALSVLDGC